MPIYTYKCSCGSITEQYNTVANRKNGPACECGDTAELKIVPTQLAPVLGGGDFPGYKCPVTEKWITSRRKRKYIMDSNNLIEVGDRKPTGNRIDPT